MVRQIRCVLMRGGTSKAVFLKESDLLIDEVERNRTILSISGRRIAGRSTGWAVPIP